MKDTLFWKSFFCILILTLVRAGNVNATVYFSDDFSTQNLNKWVQDDGNVGSTGSWFVQDGLLHGLVSSNKYSYLYAKDLELPLEYSMESTVMNISGVDQQFLFNVSSDRKKYYIVDYRYDESGWSQDNNNIVIYKKRADGSTEFMGRYPSDSFGRKYNITQNVYHKVGVMVSPSRLRVYFDDEPAIDVTDYSSAYYRGGFGVMNWGGNFQGDSENIYKKISISSDVLPKNKLILLPGLGASWNAEAMLTNNTVAADQWKMTPFVKNYDSLIKGFEENNYEKNENFFVYNYDWRKPLSEIVSDFDAFAGSIHLAQGQKLDLVGHSLGGLTARIWSQDHADVVGKLITLGSPHYGSVKAYEAWNGVKLGDGVDFSSIALNVLLQLQKKNQVSNVETLRSYAPIVHDLLPSFDFLRKNGASKLTEKSEFLTTANNNTASISGKLVSFSGTGKLTKEWITLGERSLFDKVLGIWNEGRPVGYEYGVGDGTVLKKSALIPDSENIAVESEHGILPGKSVNLVLNKLGLGTSVSDSNTYPDKQAIFYIGSPATMTVVCDGVSKEEQNSWVVFEGRDSAGCQVNLLGKDGGGTYHLVVGDNQGWNYFENEIGDGQSMSVVIGSQDSDWQVLKSDLEKLGAEKAVEKADSGDIFGTVEAYLAFRTTEADYKYAEEILEKMRLILNTNPPSQEEMDKLYFASLADKAKVEINLRLKARQETVPSYEAALSNSEAEAMMEHGKEYGANYLASKLYRSVWR